MSTFVNKKDISTLYSYEPAVKNLYKITISDMDKSDSTSQDTLSGLGWADNNETLLHAISVSLPSDSLQLERNPVTKKFSLGDKGGYKWSDTLTIQWRETRDWAIKKMHQKWLNLFYDKSRDCYLSTKSGNETEALAEALARYKQFKITLPNGDVAVCDYVTPQNQWNLDLAWGNSANIVTYQIVYNVDYWYWENNKDNTIL